MLLWPTVSRSESTNNDDDHDNNNIYWVLTMCWEDPELYIHSLIQFLWQRHDLFFCHRRGEQGAAGLSNAPARPARPW